MRRKESGGLTAGSFYLFKFGQSQRVVVFDFELHKPHIGWVGELCDDTQSREQSGGRSTQTERKKGNETITHFKIVCEIVEQV